MDRFVKIAYNQFFESSSIKTTLHKLDNIKDECKNEDLEDNLHNKPKQSKNEQIVNCHKKSTIVLAPQFDGFIFYETSIQSSQKMKDTTQNEVDIQTRLAMAPCQSNPIKFRFQSMILGWPCFWRMQFKMKLTFKHGHLLHHAKLTQLYFGFNQ